MILTSSNTYSPPYSIVSSDYRFRIHNIDVLAPSVLNYEICPLLYLMCPLDVYDEVPLLGEGVVAVLAHVGPHTAMLLHVNLQQDQTGFHYRGCNSPRLRFRV
jgi:hypothetical protein